jgi:DNA-binding GntR family transcriptional regulator
VSTYSIAEELGMSRTPVISALHRLKADGLIEIIPKVGCRILPRDPAEIAETFMIRASLEGLSAELAARRITDDELVALEQVLLEAEAAVESGDAQRYERANRAFHGEILRISRLTHLGRMLDNLWQINRYQLAAQQFLAERMTVSRAEHRAIFHALAARDPVASEASAKSHLRRCSDDYLTWVDEHREQLGLGAQGADGSADAPGVGF